MQGLAQQILAKKYIVGGVLLGTIIPSLYFLTQYIKKLAQKQNKVGRLYVGIQLGGTNYNVAIGEAITNNKGDIIDFRIIKRTNGITYENPERSIAQIIRFIRVNQAQQDQESSIINSEHYHFIGIASFGPLSLNKHSQNYGSITTTPKQLWRNVPVLNKIQAAFPSVKIGIDTDVNAAAFAEFKLGNHAVRESLAYITIGTGVGVGVIIHGKTVHGLTHPEGGHIMVQRHCEEYEHFLGVCPYHKSCLEGMCNNKSIAERLKVDFTDLAEISDSSKVWKLVGFYLAQLCLNITLLISPEVIVMGGGVMNRKILFTYIRQEFLRLLAKYVQHPLFHPESIDRYIVPPKLGADVGLKGGMILTTLTN